MGISTDFKNQWQYFVKKILLLSQKLLLCRNIALSQYRFIAISLYCNIARQNRSSDEGLIELHSLVTFFLNTPR
jgi:hypothetical protein